MTRLEVSQISILSCGAIIEVDDYNADHDDGNVDEDDNDYFELLTKYFIK